ncbi:MAG TPA: Pvc16 family protein [Candidatus Nanoarchaeia archaeon]|nr:Pvc16 family protein [Candidatus Nanoarchaeia archaeon]
MTNSLAILDLSKAIASQLWNGFKDDLQTNALVTSQDQIGFSSPKTTSAGKKKLSIFLYNVTSEQTSKNGSTAVDSGQMDFATRYLITPCTGNAENDLILLAKTLQILSEKPIIETSNAGDVDVSNTLTITLDTLSLDDLGKLWMALDEPLKPSLSVTVKFGVPVSMQQATPVLTVGDMRVMELYQTVFETFEQQVNDWKNRNLFQKQYVQSDFAKTTGVSVEGMRAELKDLGHRLETNRPVDPCMEALKRLQEFYEHQLGMIKGFEKVQKKRQEGIDMVAKWKTDVAALIEALNAKKQ